MSADNWDICPRCVHRAQATYEKDTMDVGELYGKIPHDEWLAKNASLKPVDSEDFRTFREDYEFYGAQAGEIVADYSGNCSVCNLGVDFKINRRFWSPESPDA